MRVELAAFRLSLFARAALAGLTRAANPDDRGRITAPETRRRLTRRKAPSTRRRSPGHANPGCRPEPSFSSVMHMTQGIRLSPIRESCLESENDEPALAVETTLGHNADRRYAFDAVDVSWVILSNQFTAPLLVGERPHCSCRCLGHVLLDLSRSKSSKIHLIKLR
jgi:hypothetical protein